MSKPKKYAVNIPITRNGPNGISLLIVRVFEAIFKLGKRCKRRIIIDKNAPAQKPIVIALIEEATGKKAPMPSANFTSPKPIQAPCEKNQIENMKRKTKRRP